MGCKGVYITRTCLHDESLPDTVKGLLKQVKLITDIQIIYQIKGILIRNLLKICSSFSLSHICLLFMFENMFTKLKPNALHLFPCFCLEMTYLRDIARNSIAVYLT